MTRSIFALILLCLLCGLACAQDTPAPPPPPTPPAAAPNELPRYTPAFRPPQIVTCILGALRLIELRQISTIAIKLGLSEEEKAKVLNLLTKAGEDLTPKTEAQRKAAEEFATLLIKEGATADEISAAGEKAMKAETEVLQSKIKTLFALRAMLTPEQNKSLTDLLRVYAGQWMRSGGPFAVPGTMPGPPPTPPAPPAANGEAK